MADLTAFFGLLDALPVAPDAEALYDRSTPQGRLRRANLERYLGLVAALGPTTALVAEAPGWRGATVTGVPFMSVRELTARPGLVSGAPDGDGFAAPVDPAAVSELSAGIVQRALAAWPGPAAVSWPIVPLHPFRAGDPRTNRAPRAREVRAGAPVALELLRALGIRRVVAVGRKAEGALAAAGVAAVPVRHPAQGGAGLFRAAMAGLASGNEATGSGE